MEPELSGLDYEFLRYIQVSPSTFFAGSHRSV